MPVTYITADELAELIKGPGPAQEKDPLSPSPSLVVVDVRGGDFQGGNIKGCVNRPSAEFLAHGVDALVRENHERGVRKVVFHCSLSQVRGPKAARIYEETRRNLEIYKDVPQDIHILRGGFAQFQAKFRDDPLLVENWDKNVWG